jgi:DNA (cytosine-5)-methyltransferase 1
MSMKKLTAIDLFSGAGGISLGMQAAGYEVLAASDFDSACAKTYRRNFSAHPFIERDIRQLSSHELMDKAGIGSGELDVLVGGPPCQGFSIIGSRLVLDPRNNLFRDFLRIGDDIRPKCILMENVPGMATLAGGAALSHIVDSFKDIGYRVAFAELLAAQYGVPQMRWRMVFIAFREDLGIDAGYGFPIPTHGRRGIGELVPNCTINAADMAGFVTTKQAIGDLPIVNPGEEVTIYQGNPRSAYQRLMRKGAPKNLSNHYAPKLSSLNIQRIRHLSPGQNWRDLPFDLLPDGMKRAKRKDHTRRYSRMTWDGTPRSIITRFRDPKSGEYTHPRDHRTISIREAARIQSFPDRFVFEGAYSDLYNQVGNAVPPLLAEAIGIEVAKCLNGKPTRRLENPFSRRKGLLQASLGFDLGQEVRSSC